MPDKQREKDLKLLMRDFNEKTGADNSGYGLVMGKKMNENEKLLADFCVFNNMIIGGIIFPHEDIDKTTWRSPDHGTENQINQSTICALGQI